MEEISLNWSEAEVKDSTLSVPIQGDPPDGWSENFETTAKLLGHGDWGEVGLEENTVQVQDVSPGSEEKLRFYLESLVTQANAHLESDEEEEEKEGSSEEGQESEEGSAQQEDDGADSDMTDRFRAFGNGEGGSESRSEGGSESRSEDEGGSSEGSKSSESESESDEDNG